MVLEKCSYALLKKTRKNKRFLIPINATTAEALETVDDKWAVDYDPSRNVCFTYRRDMDHGSEFEVD